MPVKNGLIMQKQTARCAASCRVRGNTCEKQQATHINFEFSRFWG